MNIRDFSRELLKIYEDMSSAFSSYQRETGLNCLPGCGKCCLNPQVEASVLEMLPLALKILDQGELELWFSRLETSEQEHCMHYQAHSKDGSKGQCSVYYERPSLCRMFGVAGFYNKNQEITLSICKLIKDHDPEKTQKVLDHLNPDQIPMMIQWSYRMCELDPTIIQDKKPINQAFKEALERVALYAQYQGQS